MNRELSDSIAFQGSCHLKVLGATLILLRDEMRRHGGADPRHVERLGKLGFQALNDAHELLNMAPKVRELNELGTSVCDNAEEIGWVPPEEYPYIDVVQA